MSAISMDKLHDSRWIWLAILIGLSVLLGYWGFAEMDPGKKCWYFLYRSMQLFTLESGSMEQMPWALNVAHFMAPVAFVLAGLMAFFKSFKTGLVRFFLILRKDHVVLCGLGPRSLQLAKDFREQK